MLPTSGMSLTCHQQGEKPDSADCHTHWTLPVHTNDGVAFFVQLAHGFFSIYTGRLVLLLGIYTGRLQSGLRLGVL